MERGPAHRVSVALPTLPDNKALVGMISMLQRGLHATGRGERICLEEIRYFTKGKGITVYLHALQSELQLNEKPGT